MGRIKSMADALRREHGTGDPFELCGYCGITVVETELPQSINGFYHLHEGQGIICINTAVDERMKAVVCAHELGHSLLHEYSNTLFMQSATHFVIGRMEREADLFCACLLLPDAELGEYICDGFTVEQIANLTGLPQPMVNLRLEAGIGRGAQ